MKPLVKAQGSGSLTVVPRPQASATPGHLLKMQVHRPLPRPSESETLGPHALLTTLPEILRQDKAREPLHKSLMQLIFCLNHQH